MKELLYIGKPIAKVIGGADQGNKRNLQLLNEIFAGKITYIEPAASSLYSNLFLGITNSALKQIDAALSSGRYSHVFVSQSLMGRAVKYIKKHFPQITILVYFHNIEIDYARSYLKVSGWKALPFYGTVKLWERYTCRYADKLITLNARDTRRLAEVYGRTSSAELPMSFTDVYDALRAKALDKGKDSEITYLFVGIAFFPNIEGIQWFITNVLPHVPGRLVIAGKGMDQVAFQDLTERVSILGYVPDLSQLYYSARFVVSPIFSGAGMKTKTAEALMYGKTIIGTVEAFEGYIESPQSMHLCMTASQWVDTILELSSAEGNINEFSRSVFTTHYDTRNRLPVMQRLVES